MKGIWILSFLLIAGVVGLFFWFHSEMHSLSIPNLENIKLEKKGQYGDSFGALTSLFTGLALAGLFITIMIQRKELKGQKVEFEKMNNFHKESINLETMNILYNAYQKKIVACNEDSSKYNFSSSSVQVQKNNELIANYQKNSTAIFGHFEKIFNNKELFQIEENTD